LKSFVEIPPKTFLILLILQLFIKTAINRGITINDIKAEKIIVTTLTKLSPKFKTLDINPIKNNKDKVQIIDLFNHLSLCKVSLEKYLNMNLMNPFGGN